MKTTVPDEIAHRFLLIVSGTMDIKKLPSFCKIATAKVGEAKTRYKTADTLD